MNLLDGNTEEEEADGHFRADHGSGVEEVAKEPALYMMS